MPAAAPPGFRSAFERPANCTAIRANNSRALVLWNIDRTRILPVIDALDDAGFEVGVLHEACRPGDFEHSICTVDSPRIRFVRRVDTINPQRLMDAVKSFVPCAGFQKWDRQARAGFRLAVPHFRARFQHALDLTHVMTTTWCRAASQVLGA